MTMVHLEISSRIISLMAIIIGAVALILLIAIMQTTGLGEVAPSVEGMLVALGTFFLLFGAIGMILKKRMVRLSTVSHRTLIMLGMAILFLLGFGIFIRLMDLSPVVKIQIVSLVVFAMMLSVSITLFLQRREALSEKAQFSRNERRD